MIKIEFSSEIQNYNPIERTCMVILNGIAIKDGNEVGRFVIATKLLSEIEYDLYMNQANQTVDEKFLSKWKEKIIKPLLEGFKQFEMDSNINWDKKIVK